MKVELSETWKIQLHKLTNNLHPKHWLKVNIIFDHEHGNMNPKHFNLPTEFADKFKHWASHIIIQPVNSPTKNTTI